MNLLILDSNFLMKCKMHRGIVEISGRCCVRGHVKVSHWLDDLPGHGFDSRITGLLRVMSG